MAKNLASLTCDRKRQRLIERNVIMNEGIDKNHSAQNKSLTFCQKDEKKSQIYKKYIQKQGIVELIFPTKISHCLLVTTTVGVNMSSIVRNECKRLTLSWSTFLSSLRDQHELVSSR